MTEHRLFDPEHLPDFFTNSWYDTREHAPHLEQGAHVDRLMGAAEAAAGLIRAHDLKSVVDLGCGDGGLLQVLGGMADIPMWGYDLMQTNIEYGRATRGVGIEYLDFVHSHEVVWGDLCVITECLEHLQDPHALVRRIGRHCKYIVASSPAWETPESHDACHAWAWDLEGYEDLLRQGGFRVTYHIVTDGYGFQVIVGERVA